MLYRPLVVFRRGTGEHDHRGANRFSRGMSDTPVPQLRSWALALLWVGPAVIAWNVLVVPLLPPGWEVSILIVATFLPWLFMWTLSGASLLAIGSWLLPTVTAIGIGWVLLPLRPFLFLLLVVAVTLWSISCTAVGWRLYARYNGWVGDRIASTGLTSTERAAYRRLMALARPDRATRQATGQLDDLPRAISGFRTPSEEMLKITPPDPEWALAIRLTAELGLMYADMLEGKRGVDYDAVKGAARERDVQLQAVLEARSPLYRLLMTRLHRPREDSPQRS